MHLPFLAYPILLVTGLAAGLVDSIAGGGGLIALPVLLNLGIPPSIALGTNKLQSAAGTSIASRHFINEGAVDLRSCRLGIFFTFAGALAGVWTVQHVDSHILGKVIPILLAAILIHMFFRPELGERHVEPRMDEPLFFVLAGLGLGFYDGFFGPGVGSLWTISLVLVLGQDFVRATGRTKVMNLTSNIASLVVFIPAHHVLYGPGLTMCAGQVIGARVGAGLAIKKGSRFIRPAFLTIVALTLVRLVYLAVRS